MFPTLKALFSHVILVVAVTRGHQALRLFPHLWSIILRVKFSPQSPRRVLESHHDICVPDGQIEAAGESVPSPL